MKYLNLSSLLVLFVLLSSCYSTDVFLRGSKGQELPHSEQNIETETSTYTITEPEIVTPSSSENTPHQEVNILTDQPNNAVLKDDYTPISQISGNAPAVHTSSKTANNNSVKSESQLQFNHSKTHASTNKNLSPPSKGVFGSVGRSFGVVGIVFIFVGLILFLIGGILIDTLGALFLGFGLVFLLIWLVLAILQGLFDVIL